LSTATCSRCVPVSFPFGIAINQSVAHEDMCFESKKKGKI
jgi:hypothetical protein